MKKIYKIILPLLMVTSTLWSQREVTIPASDDPTNLSDLFTFITGDTLATGERTDSNTIYKLENGKVYINTGRFNSDFDLNIEAVDLADIDNKPIITRIPNNDGSYPTIMHARGNVTLRNLWIISAERGPLEQHQWGSLRLYGEGTRLIADNCLIEKDRGGFFQLRADNIKAYITNCVFRNGGNRRVSNGNGRGFDSRNFWMDTLIMRNTIVHNIQDRFFRSQGGTEPHNYLEIDHCTSFNTNGRHGHIQLGRALKVKITNNLFINPIMMGSSAVYREEQTQPDNELHKVITIDSLYENTELTISNNNIFWTQDVLDYWASNDTVSAPGVLSQLVIDNLGDAADNAFFSEPLELNSVPQSILQYVIDLYNNPASEEMFDFIVEDVSLAGTPFDSGNLFDFATFDACYSENTTSATAATNGGAIGATAQCDNLVVVPEEARFVLIEANDDPTNLRDIFTAITSDTTDTGERVSMNTTYLLENGKVYINTGRFNVDYPLQIEAVDLEDKDNKPIITRIPNNDGSYPTIMHARGNVTLRNLWIISAERGPLEQHQWGSLRLYGEGTRLIAEDCLIEKDRGGFFQIRADNIKAYITNCVFRNGGNRRVSNGNGRGFDSRNFWMDTLIMRNTIVHNIQDRFFRSQGGTEPHNYLEIDHCTSFNTNGRHGHIQLGRALKVKITNNLFINPIMMGSSAVYREEQTQPDNELHKVITIDSLYENTELTISNNNIFWSQDVLDYWASNDTVFAPEVLSQLVIENLGDAVDNAFFSEPLELNSVPQSILQYVIDLYNNPASEEMFDFIVEDIALEGTPFDSGNLFDFDTFSPCYSSENISATAATDGGPIGAVTTCENLVSEVFDLPNDPTIQLKVNPNPVRDGIGFVEFSLGQSSDVVILTHDISGKVLGQRFIQKLFSGNHRIELGFDNQYKPGLYFVSVATESGVMSTKVIVQ
jgi:hypothetical protein